MIKYKALVPCLFLLGAMGISTAKADQVVFNNGDRLSGTIISMRDARTLYFRSNIAGDMRIGWGDVSELYDDNLNMIAIPEAPPPLVSPLTGINDSAVQTWTQTTEKGGLKRLQFPERIVPRHLKMTTPSNGPGAPIWAVGSMMAIPAARP